MNQKLDDERSVVYVAELAAFDGTDLEVVLGLDSIVSLVTKLTQGGWWPGPTIEVRPARSDAHASSARCSDAAFVAGAIMVRFAVDQTTIATAAHELAHALAGLDAGHGPIFRRAYLDVVGVITNLDSTDRRGSLHVVQLTDEFTIAGISVGERCWVDPPPHGPIAL